MINKLTNINNLNIIRIKNSEKKIVLTHGVFDLVHIGHIDYLKEAKLSGDLLVVSVTASKFVNKGFNRPYFDDQTRLRFLSELSIVDYVVLSNNISAEEVIRNLKPDYYIKGPDYKIYNNDKAGNLEVEKKQFKNTAEV